jgi:basic membrane protein A
MSGFYVALPDQWEVINVEVEGVEAILDLLSAVDEEWAQASAGMFTAEGMSEMIRLWALDPEPAGIGYASVNIVQETNPFPISLEDLCTQMPALYEMMDLEVLQTECDLEINNQEAARFTLRLNLGIFSIIEYMYVIVNENDLWMMTFAIGENESAEYEPLFNEIADTWRIMGMETDFRVGFVTDTAGINDMSFNATYWNGILRAQDSLGIKAYFLESDDPSQYVANLTDFAIEDFDLVVAPSFFLGGALAEVSADFPGVNFTIGDYAYPDPFAVPEGMVGHAECIPNVQGQVFKTDQASFLAGYLAAGMTETGKLGTFGGARIPTVTIFGVGFQMGMEHYNQVHGTDVELHGWDNETGEGLFTGDFGDLAKGREAAESLFDEGADIFIPVGGLIGLPGFNIARERGGYGIWVDTDGYESLPDVQDVILTSVMKNFDNAVYDVIEAANNGKFDGCGVYIGDLANSGVGIAPYHDLESVVPEQLKTEIEELTQKIISGEIKDTGCVSYPQYCPGGLY